MPILTVLHDGNITRITFEGTCSLCDVLARHGLMPAQPCGGRGACGKCAAALTGMVSEPNEAERRAGTRLVCQAILLGDAQVTLPKAEHAEQIAMGSRGAFDTLCPMAGRYGAAVDLGTTTIALQCYELQTGRKVGQAAMFNPQRAISSDVMGRISAAMSGEPDLLCQQANQAICSLLQTACPNKLGGSIRMDAMVITGNTTMLYLLTRRAPDSLSRAPFLADCLFDETTELLGAQAYLPPCMHAFIGADTTCAVLASRLTDSGDTSLLLDIGTNGEIALWKQGRLFVTSTAAGPAFEGAGISCGIGSVSGAIDRVWLEGSRVQFHTLGGQPACGLCGSGLIDAVAAYLQLGEIDPSGAMEADLPLADGVTLHKADIYSLMLAKAAIAAGIDTQLEITGTKPEDIHSVYIAGGFGSRLNLRSAAMIGLLPPLLATRAKVIGNAALDGAAEMLLNTERIVVARRIAKEAKHIDLGGNERFNERYLAHMRFPAAD